nr:hypothetical protein [uncultured Dethiosulfovibrio sp.]
MFGKWLKRLIVSAVVEDINSNGRIRRALREIGGEGPEIRIHVSSVSQEEFSRCCQDNQERFLPLIKKFSDGTISITEDRVVVGCPLRGEASE